VGGIADIGAFEVQSTDGPLLPGDYNGNRTVDAADYVIWRKTLGSQVNRYEGADGNGNNSIDVDDFNVWRGNFGRMLSGASIIAPSLVDEAVGAQPFEMGLPVSDHFGAMAADKPNSELDGVSAAPRRYLRDSANTERVVELLSIEAGATAEASHFSPKSAADAAEIGGSTPKVGRRIDAPPSSLLDVVWAEWPRALERL
jgi:hypothetical protein